VKRECGTCNLCCKLLPVRAVGKGANEACKFQKFRKGCTVYHQPAMPPECRLWSCRWLVNDDAGELRRPDHAHYVIDIMPDFVTAVDNETGVSRHIQVVQIWCDPGFPDAHRDPALRRWIERRAEQGVAAIVRFGSNEAITIIAPPLDAGGQWHEISNGTREETHSVADIVAALSQQAANDARET
jgi:hypothetical protein